MRFRLRSLSLVLLAPVVAYHLGGFGQPVPVNGFFQNLDCSEKFWRVRSRPPQRNEFACLDEDRDGVIRESEDFGGELNIASRWKFAARKDEKCRIRIVAIMFHFIATELNPES